MGIGISDLTYTFATWATLPQVYTGVRSKEGNRNQGSLIGSTNTTNNLTHHLAFAVKL